MLRQISRRLTGRKRTVAADRQLGFVLAFVAGAVNAGGFLAVHRYTSHMTGIVSSMADSLALGELGLVAAGVGAVLAFLCGAACSAILVNFSRRRRMHSEFALPLLLEAVLLLVFGLLGPRAGHAGPWALSALIMMLTFLMGLQNAVVTKLSNAVIRTTHVTGIVTDIGIQLGRMAYWNAPSRSGQPRVAADMGRLRTLTGLFVCFFLGGILGALGFKHFGFTTTVPLAVLLITLASLPAWDDLVVFWRTRRS
ncbi:MAG: YoaK family protein [Flavobacteriales bacterium]